MDIIKTYASFIKKSTETNPKTSLNMIKLGLWYELTRVTRFPEKGVPMAYRKLNSLCVESVRDALIKPENSAWVNLFAPVEILHAFGINPLSIEAFSSFMCGFKCEDFFIDYAEKNGIAETLCSYHKNFIGAAEADVLPRPKFAVTTSMICDGNLNTFRYLAEKYHLPCYTLDIPQHYSKESEAYVVQQLYEMIAMIEEVTGKKYDEDQLKEVIHRENVSKTYFKEFLNFQAYKHYPSSLSLHMYTLFASHLSIGTKSTLDYYKLLSEDIKNYPESDGIKIFWVHLFPYYHKTLCDYFNFNPRYQIQGYDMNLDYMEEMDESHPIEALARKMILNIYNGSYERKIETISKTIDKFNPDGAIHFCHWGCKQSTGGVMLLKEALKEKKIPMLILDGDGVDRRNSPEGQIKTRLEAFLEMLEKQKDVNTDDRLCL